MTAVHPLGLSVGGRLRELAAGIVDEHVEARMLRARRWRYRRAAFGFADIQSLGIDRRAEASKKVSALSNRSSLRPRMASRAEASKQAGDRQTQAAAGTGDDHDLAPLNRSHR